MKVLRLTLWGHHATEKGQLLFDKMDQAFVLVASQVIVQQFQGLYRYLKFLEIHNLVSSHSIMLHV